MYDFIEYKYIFLNIFSDNALVSAGCNHVYLVAFYYEFLNYISFKNVCTVVGYFLPMIIIHTLVLCLEGKSLLRDLLFVDWEI